MYIKILLYLALQINVLYGNAFQNDTTGTDTKEEEILIAPGDVFSFTLPPHATIALTATNVASSISFLMFQAHAYLQNVTISYDKIPLPHGHVAGANVGLVVDVRAKVESAVYLGNPNNQSINLLAQLLGYKANDPVPGGCAMEFELPTSPYLRARVTDSVVDVEYQPAATPPNVRKFYASCDPGELQYEVYHYYLPARDYSESLYYDAIKRMSSVKSIRKNGHSVTPIDVEPKTRLTFSAYEGVGTVTAVVVYNVGSSVTGTAAYVPYITYACDVTKDDGCLRVYSTFSHLCCISLVLIGLSLCFVGHFYWRTSLWIFMLYAVILIVATVYRFDFTNVEEDLFIIITFFCIFGSTIIFLQLLFFSLTMIVLWDTLFLGFFFSSVLFTSPFADLYFFKDDLSYWLAFASGTLFVPSLLIYFRTVGSTISSAAIGAFAIILAIDFYVGTNLKYMLLNVWRRMTVPKFNRAVLDLPMQEKDTFLLALWLFITLLGVALQGQLTRWIDVRRSGRSRLDYNDERRPLLGSVEVRQTTPPSYHSVSLTAETSRRGIET